MSHIGRSNIVPFGKKFVVRDLEFSFHGIGGIAPEFVGFCDDVDGCPKPGTCSCATHQRNDGIQTVEEHAGAGACHMGKESPFSSIVLGAVGWVVRDPDFHADCLAQPFQIVFEYILRGRIAPIAIASQEDGCRVGIALLSDSIPVPLEGITGELGGVARKAKIEMASVSQWVVDSMRNDHPVGPAGEIVIKGLKW